MNTENQIEIYQAADGQTQIEVQLQGPSGSHKPRWWACLGVTSRWCRAISVTRSRKVRSAIKAICKRCILQIPTAPPSFMTWMW